MKNGTIRIISLVFLSIFGSVIGSAQTTKANDVKIEYERIEIAKFDIKKGVEKFTDSSLDVMMVEIVEQLKKLDKFKEVTLEAEKVIAASETSSIKTNIEMPDAERKQKDGKATLRLMGTVIEYKEGNRKARFIVGLGAGRAKIKARIKILDSSGAILFEKDVDGNVVMGAFGGDSGGITRGLAKEVAKVTLKKFF